MPGTTIATDVGNRCNEPIEALSARYTNTKWINIPAVNHFHPLVPFDHELNHLTVNAIIPNDITRESQLAILNML